MAKAEDNQADSGVTDSDQLQPGQVIAPGGAPVPPPAAPEMPVAVVSDATTFEDTAAPDQTTEQFAALDEGAIGWTASEYIAHEKSINWYLALAGIAALLAVLTYLLTRDVISCVVVIVCAAVFGGYAARKPRELQYQLDGGGFSIGDKYYPLSEFRCFSVNEDAAIPSVDLLPLKRFMPVMTIYYHPDDQDPILSVLSAALPFEDHHLDAVDRLLKKIRF